MRWPGSADQRLEKSSPKGSRSKGWVNGYSWQIIEQWSYGNLEEVIGDSSGEWQRGTHLPFWGMKRLGTGLPRRGRDQTQEEKAAEEKKSWRKKKWELRDKMAVYIFFFLMQSWLQIQEHCWVIPGQSSLENKGKITHLCVRSNSGSHSQ